MARTYYRQAGAGFPLTAAATPGKGAGVGSGLVGCLLQQGLDELGEAVPGPIEAALHGAQVAARNVGDLGVALAFQLAERSEEHTSELQSLTNLVCRLLLEKKKKKHIQTLTTKTISN